MCSDARGNANPDNISVRRAFVLRLVRLVLRLLTLPQSAISRLKRYVLLTRFLAEGRGVVLDPIHSLFSAERICLGDNVFIGENAYLGGSIFVDDNVMISRSVTIVAGGHLYAIQGRRPRFIQPSARCVAREDAERIRIEDDCWIGARVTIVGSLAVGMGTVVGAGSVVSSSIPPYVVAVGNPCRPIKRIFDDAQLASHLATIGYPPNVVLDTVARRVGMESLPVVDNSSRYTSADYDYLPL